MLKICVFIVKNVFIHLNKLNIKILTFHISDIYVGVLSNQNQVASKDYYLGFVSTTVETSNPEAELKPGLDLLEPVSYTHLTLPTIYSV